MIHTPLPSSYEENDPLEENFFRPLPESIKEEYEIKSIIPERKDLPISTKEKNQNTEFTDYITIRRNPFSSDVTKLRDTTWTYFPIQTNYIHAYTMTLLPDQPIRNHDRRTTTTWPTTVNSGDQFLIFIFLNPPPSLFLFKNFTRHFTHPLFL